MAKNPFIRATEIWTPTKDRRHLDLTAGLYGPDLSYFEGVSRGMRFAYDEGLPGKCWAAGTPILLKNLTSSYFRRGDAAMTVGLTCALALPIFMGADLSAIIVFFCGDDQNHVGALELWSLGPGEAHLALVDGYFGTAETFEFASRQTVFPRRMGLPGQVWDQAMPVIMEDLGRGSQFLRLDSAETVGINRAVGMPCAVRGDGTWVLTFLTALNTPIARRFECWMPDRRAGVFRFATGYCESGEKLAETYARAVMPLDLGAFATVRLSGVPAIRTDLAAEPGPVCASALAAGLSQMVALPIVVEGQVKAILAWFL